MQIVVALFKKMQEEEKCNQNPIVQFYLYSGNDTFVSGRFPRIKCLFQCQNAYGSHTLRQNCGHLKTGGDL